MNELIELAHQFLQNFCLGDRPNQALLYKSIDLFLNPGVSFLYFFFTLDTYCETQDFSFSSHILVIYLF